MKKPKVLVVTSIRSYHQVDLFDAVHELGEVDLCVFYLRAMTPGRLWDKLPEPKHPYRMLPAYFNSSLLYVNPSIISYLRRESPDLAIICQYAGTSYQAAMLYLSAARIPWVFWSENPGVQYFEVKDAVPRRLKPLLRLLAFQPVARFATEVWGIGRRASQTMTIMGGRNAHDLPYYSDLTRFSGTRESAPKGRVRFLFAGRLSYRKGFDVACDAFAHLARQQRSGWELTICGDGELREMERRLAGAPVNSIGFRQLADIPALMREHDILITPSRYDGWGMVVPEALAAGLPVVATTEMQSAVAIGEGQEPVVSLLPAGDATALLRQVEWWIDHRSELSGYSEQAEVLSRNYDSKVGAKRLSDLARRAARTGR